MRFPHVSFRGTTALVLLSSSVLMLAVKACVRGVSLCGLCEFCVPSSSPNEREGNDAQDRERPRAVEISVATLRSKTEHHPMCSGLNHAAENLRKLAILTHLQPAIPARIVR
jgi:hypothetical protein